MSPIHGLDGAAKTGHARGRPPVSFEVTLPYAKPTRAQIADAFHAYFGFSRNDITFLKKHFGGTDPFAYFARTLEYNPRSVTVKNGQAKIRLEVDARDYEVMHKLAELHHSMQTNMVDGKAVVTPVNAKEAVQVKQVLDHGTMVKERLQRQVEAKGKSEEGISSFLEGAIAGDFSENDSWSKAGGQIAAGAIPIYGQIADARDTAAAVHDIWNGKEGAWFGLGAAAIGWIPIVGDGIKAGIRVSRHAMKEGAEQVVEQTAKQVTRSTVTEVTSTEIRAAGGLRRAPLNELSTETVEQLKKEFAEVGGDPSILRFNRGRQTAYIDNLDIINVRGDILPIEGAIHPRSSMSSRAVMAHELGHKNYRGTKVPPGAWNDEFRASYWAAKNAPNLTDKERRQLLQDAITRAQEAGVPIRFNKFMRRMLYGF